MRRKNITSKKKIILIVLILFTSQIPISLAYIEYLSLEDDINDVRVLKKEVLERNNLTVAILENDTYNFYQNLKNLNFQTSEKQYPNMDLYKVIIERRESSQFLIIEFKTDIQKELNNIKGVNFILYYEKDGSKENSSIIIKASYSEERFYINGIETGKFNYEKGVDPLTMLETAHNTKIALDLNRDLFPQQMEGKESPIIFTYLLTSDGDLLFDALVGKEKDFTLFIIIASIGLVVVVCVIYFIYRAYKREKKHTRQRK